MKVIGDNVYLLNEEKEIQIIFDFDDMKNNEKYLDLLKLENEMNSLFIHSILRYTIALDNIEAFHFLYYHNLINNLLKSNEIQILLDSIHSPKIEKYLLEQIIKESEKTKEKIKV